MMNEEQKSDAIDQRVTGNIAALALPGLSRGFSYSQGTSLCQAYLPTYLSLYIYMCLYLIAFTKLMPRYHVVTLHRILIRLQQ